MNDRVDKIQCRAIYPFKSDDAFETFYSGLNYSFAGDTESSIEMFARVVEMEPENPLGYNFLLMSLEFDESSTEDERMKWAEEWVRVAEKSGIETQIVRANASLKWYKMTPKERGEAFGLREVKHDKRANKKT